MYKLLSEGTETEKEAFIDKCRVFKGSETSCRS